MLGAPGGICNAIKYANGKSVDKLAARLDSASTPPADAPIATTPNESLPVDWVTIFDYPSPG
jgi:hypothetical protein